MVIMGRKEEEQERDLWKGWGSEWQRWAPAGTSGAHMGVGGLSLNMCPPLHALHAPPSRQLSRLTPHRYCTTITPPLINSHLPSSHVHNTNRHSRHHRETDRKPDNFCITNKNITWNYKPLRNHLLADFIQIYHYKHMDDNVYILCW